MTSATLGAFASLTTGSSGSYAASYDGLGRLTSQSTTHTPSGGASSTLYSVAPTYDALGNVIENVTTLPQGVDTQVFCYDDLSRLTWAGSSGTPSCSGAPTPSDTGSLAGTGGAQYSASYSYDTLNRLTASPLGNYTYGDSAHADAATAIGSAWSASYDAAGDLTCRAATSATTCAGSSPTGATLAYDNEGQLAQWLSAPTNPTASASYLYDGEGHRVEQVATSNGTTTTTAYIGSLEEIATTGATTTTAYYGGLATSVNGALSYTLADGLGSVSESVNATTGAVTATQLYAPYGAVRYQSGSLPTDHGFTGQVSDAATSGLDYYGARYYDPLAGQFTSADPLSSMGLSTLVYHQQASASPSTPDGSAQRQAPPRDGLNVYLYVKGNPETLTDPTGLWSVGICISLGAGVGIGGFLQGCAVVAQSDNGQWTGGLTGTVGGGASVGAEAEGGVGIQVSNAQQVSNLGGPFNFAGGTVADEVGGGVIGFTGQDSQGRQVTGADFQVVVGAGIAGYGGTSKTDVLESKGPDIHTTPAQQWYHAIHGPFGPVSRSLVQAWDVTTQAFGQYQGSATQVFGRLKEGWTQFTKNDVPNPKQVWPSIAPWLSPTRWLH